jgi:hypothetical protein
MAAIAESKLRPISKENLNGLATIKVLLKDKGYASRIILTLFQQVKQSKLKKE